MGGRRNQIVLVPVDDKHQPRSSRTPDPPSDALRKMYTNNELVKKKYKKQEPRCGRLQQEPKCGRVKAVLKSLPLFYENFIKPFGLSLLITMLLLSYLLIPQPNKIRKNKITHEIKQLKYALDTIGEELRNAEADCLTTAGDVKKIKQSLKDLILNV